MRFEFNTPAGYRAWLTALVLAGSMGISACTSSTSAIDSARPAKTAATQGAEVAASDEAVAEGAKVIRQPATVAQKGTYIKVLVNGEPITNYDIQRRAKFRQVRRLKATTSETEKELIDQIGVMFLAGHETSASALSWALYLMARDREVQERMHAETELAFGQEGGLQPRHFKFLKLTRDVFRETLFQVRQFR